MRSKNRFLVNLCAACQLLFLALSLPAPIFAQGSSQTPDKENPSSQDSSKSPSDSESAPATPVGLTWAGDYIHQIGNSGLLAGNREGLRWGGLYLPTASITGIVDRFEATNTTPGTDYEAMVLQTTVVYDHLIGRNRLAIQYQPSIAFSGGQVVRDFSNQNTSLDVLIYARPRWNIRFNDGFQYRYSQRSVGYPYFDVNPVNSGTVTNNFIDGPSRWLSNTAYVSTAYALSARSSIAVSPSYTFSEAGTGTSFTRGVSYGGNAYWTYRTSQRQTLGFQYGGQLLHETSSGITTDTVYHNFAGTVGRQLSANWSVTGAAGATTSSSSSANSTRQWAFYGAFGLVRQFLHSSLALNYSRGDTLSNGLISNQYADRTDLTYQTQMTKRLSWSVGGGYLRQTQAGGFAGWYTASNVRFLLAPRAGLLATFDYNHKNQKLGNNVTNVFSGNRDIFTFGIMWYPAAVPH